MASPGSGPTNPSPYLAALQTPQQDGNIDQLANQLARTALGAPPGFAQSPRLRVVQNVHQDDIHNIIRLDDGCFITGSKDRCLKKWDLQGALVRVVQDAQHPDYRRWTTALARLNSTHWISGTRDGQVQLWNNEGDHLGTLPTKHAPFPQNLNCKQRNVHRVNCLASFEEKSGLPLFLVGWATQFSIHNYRRGGQRNQFEYTSDHDWVYCLHPLSKREMLVVTGCQLDLWRCQEHHPYGWTRSSVLIAEGERRKQRPFISAISPLQGQPDHFSVAVFDGSVRVVDIQTGTTTFRGDEHVGRVWTVPSVRDHTFASCADDGLIKLWDVRVGANAVATVRDNEKVSARVSVLLPLPPHQLLSGSCPDRVRESAEKAQFTFWDLRRL